MNPRTSLFVISAIVSIFITAGCPQKAPTESAGDSAQESASATGLPGPVAIPIRETVTDAQVKLSWGAMPGATAYAVHFGTASDPPFVRTIATTSTTIADLQYCNTYYWRIEAIYVQGRGASAVESFRTFCPADAPAVPHYPAPANRAAAVPQLPTLSWNATAKGFTRWLAASATRGKQRPSLPG